jgi:hypothetical protein
MRLSLWSWTVAAGAFLLAAACRDASEPVAPGEVPDALLRTAPQQPSANPNALGRGVAGFGGFFLDASGVPTAYLTDPGQRGATMRALAPWFSARGVDPNQLRVIKGDFDFNRLQGWFDRASPVALAVSGSVFADLDEASNRLRFGVENAAAMAGVQHALATRGIPASAVIVELAEPIRFVATLQGQVRPVQAGLQINFGQYLCSIGFNAQSGTTRSFVTASHCTNHQGGTEGTQYYQPLAPRFGGSSEVIATEVADPVYFKGGACPKGRSCRYSDASRAAYSSGTQYVLGGIEKTTGANNNSLTISGSFQVGGKDDGVVGDIANKVGRTTGWSQGRITATDVNTSVSGSRITLLGQTFVSAKVGGGDSGSGVFIITSGTTVDLSGVLWGGNQSGTQFVFSPLSQVEQELGGLTVQ